MRPPASRRNTATFGLALCVIAGSAGGAGANPQETAARAIPEVPEKLPPGFAVMPFENRSGVSGLDWMSAAAAFDLGERLDEHPGLRSVTGSMIVPEGRAPEPATADSVAAFAGDVGARWVWTGWIKRPDWELQIAVSLWRVEEGDAARVGQVLRRGEFKELHEFTGDAATELCRRAGIAIAPATADVLHRVPTSDFYAFTLFGRGLTAFAGTVGGVDLGAAEHNLQRATFIDPELAAAQRVLGDYHVRAGELGKARSRYARALDVREGYVPALVGQASLAYRRGKPERAVELLVRGLRRRPWDFEARYLAGKVLWEIGELDRSFEQLSQIVRHRPRHVRARRILVLIHASRGDGDDLVRELEMVLELDPGDEQTRLDLGAAYASLDKPAEAIRVYRSIVEEDPEHMQALKFLGDIHKREGQLERAIAYYQRAHQVDKSDPRPYFLLGATHLEAGHHGEAEKIYKRAAKFDRYRPEVYNNLGAIAYRRGDVGTSIWYLKRAVRKRPDNPRYRYNYALSLSETRRTGDALAQVEAALELDPNNPDLHYLRGVVLLRSGDASGARASFEQAVDIEPDHADARHNLAKLDELERRAKQGEVSVESR